MGRYRFVAPSQPQFGATSLEQQFTRPGFNATRPSGEPTKYVVHKTLIAFEHSFIHYYCMFIHQAAIIGQYY